MGRVTVRPKTVCKSRSHSIQGPRGKSVLRVWGVVKWPHQGGQQRRKHGKKVPSPIPDDRPGLWGDPAFLTCTALLFWGVHCRSNDPLDHSFTRDTWEVGRDGQHADQSGQQEATRPTDKRVAWRENGERRVDEKPGAWLLEAGDSRAPRAAESQLSCQQVSDMHMNVRQCLVEWTASVWLGYPLMLPRRFEVTPRSKPSREYLVAWHPTANNYESEQSHYMAANTW